MADRLAQIEAAATDDHHRWWGLAKSLDDLRDLVTFVREIQRIVEEEDSDGGSHECSPRCVCVFGSLRAALANLAGSRPSGRRRSRGQ